MLLSQEAALILASPRLPLHLKVKGDSSDHTILLSTDFEREEWRDAIQSQQKQHQGQWNGVTLYYFVMYIGATAALYSKLYSFGITSVIWSF